MKEIIHIVGRIKDQNIQRPQIQCSAEKEEGALDGRPNYLC